MRSGLGMLYVYKLSFYQLFENLDSREPLLAVAARSKRRQGRVGRVKVQIDWDWLKAGVSGKGVRNNDINKLFNDLGEYSEHQHSLQSLQRTNAMDRSFRFPICEMICTTDREDR